MMKNSKIAFAIIALCATVFAGCRKGDGGADYGLAKVYIPQANVTGVNNHYAVPGGEGEYASLNFTVNEPQGVLNVLLSVMRSGKISNAGGFSVDVAVSRAETDATVASLAGTAGMPEELYTLAPAASVASGNNTGPIEFFLDMDRLLGSTYSGQKLVLAIAISNPTAYELSDRNTSVVVIVDVDAVRQAVEAQR